MSNENSHLLEEYKELGLYVRNDNDMLSKLTAVFLPLSITALALPYLKTGAPKLLAVSGGVTLMTVWFLSSEIVMDRLRIRFSRILVLDQILKFNSHGRNRKQNNYIEIPKSSILDVRSIYCYSSFCNVRYKS